MEFSYFTRKKDLERLDGSHFDVIVVGSGIAGAGIASLLSSNNLKVLLIDKGDFGCGTSSNSSKLIHGGLRYLAQGHILLTRELLRERNYLVKNLDIVKVLNFDILIDDDSWSKFSIYFGLFLYNFLGGVFAIPHFKKGKYSYPGYSGYFTYEDAATDDALLVIYNVVTSVMRGATAINYLEAKRFEDKEGEIETILIDRYGTGEYKVRSKLIVNAAGPWVNDIYETYSSGRIDNLKLTRGAHIIIRNGKIETQSAIAFRSYIDGRQMFIIPRGEVVIAGTTDDFTEKPDDLYVKDKEREYILNSVRKIFPSITKEDVIGEYVGIRPLYGRGSDPGRVTRDFYADVTGKMITVMGVKITNYRSASRKISKRIGKILGRKLKTKGLPEIVYRREKGDEIASALQNECPLTPEDVIRRRLGYFYFKSDQGRSKEEEVNRRVEAFIKGGQP
jgi:glycerol-3-phosphate dehydrogenase